MNSQNLFGIKNPEICECRVSAYSMGHSELYVDVRLPSGLVFLKLGFFMVEYYSGPMRWKGANFQVANAEECVAILHTLDQYATFPKNELATLFKLYSVPTTKQSPKIIAGNAEIVENGH